MQQWNGKERRSEISIAIRRHEKHEAAQFTELSESMVALTDDMRASHKSIASNYRTLADQMLEVAAWKTSHEQGDKVEHDRFFEELSAVKEPVIELKNAIEGLGTIKKGLVFLAQVVGSISVILGGLYALVHFGGKS